MHTIFRVGDITQIANSNQLYQVELKLTSNDDEQLRTLTEHIQKDTSHATGWQRMCKLLYDIGYFDRAEVLYEELLEHTFDESEKVFYYNTLGSVKFRQSDFEKSTWYYEKKHEIDQKTLPPNSAEFATSNNSIALVYDHMEEYSKTLSSHEKALAIRQKALL